MNTERTSPPLRTIVQPLFTLAVVAVFMFVLRNGMGLIGTRPAPILGTLALGFLLVTSFIAGKIVNGFGLPRITGYILFGMLAGPSLLGLVTRTDLAQLRLIDDIAISLIALSAGAELRLRELRPRMRSILTIMTTEMTAVFVIVAGSVLALGSLLPFTAARPFVHVAAVAVIFASIAIANSPSVAIAIINDTRSKGPVSQTILSVTVIKDVAVVLLFALALSIARTMLSPEVGFDTAFFRDISWEIGGSIVAGAVVGWLVAIYLRHVGANMVLFAFAIAFINSTLASELHLEVLLVSLSAGFFLENVSPVQAEPFLEAVNRNSLPIYALFFAIAGANLELAQLRELWPFALGFSALRMVAIWGGTHFGARLSKAEPEVRRYTWLGFVPQAGVTLGMVIIIARAFPTWGDELQTLFVAMVAIHQIVGPVMLQYGLQRAGEVGRRGVAVAESAEPEAAPAQA